MELVTGRAAEFEQDTDQRRRADVSGCSFFGQGRDYR